MPTTDEMKATVQAYAAAHHRGGGLVATGLQTQYDQGAAFGPTRAKVGLGCPHGPAAIVRACVHRVEVAARFPFRNGCATP